MSTIEDKILDGPRIHYCDNGDDDRRHGEDLDENHAQESADAASLFVQPDEDTRRIERLRHVKWQSRSSNTGPKGVIEDYRRNKLANSQPQNQYKPNNELDELETEFQELLNDDSIIQQYVMKRISDAKACNTPTFGYVFRLQSGTQLLDAIDKENPQVLVLVHIFSKYSKACTRLNECLDELASELKHIKMVTLDASVTTLSANFKENGVPALLAYKKGDLVKSLVRLEDNLDRDFNAASVKDILVDNGLI